MEALRYLRQQPQGTIDLISKRFATDTAVAAESYRLGDRCFQRRANFLSGDGQTPRFRQKGRRNPEIGTVDQVADASLAEEVFKEMGEADSPRRVT